MEKERKRERETSFEVIMAPGQVLRGAMRESTCGTRPLKNTQSNIVVRRETDGVPSRASVCAFTRSRKYRLLIPRFPSGLKEARVNHTPTPVCVYDRYLNLTWTRRCDCAIYLRIRSWQSIVHFRLRERADARLRYTLHLFS